MHMRSMSIVKSIPEGCKSRGYQGVFLYSNRGGDGQYDVLHWAGKDLPMRYRTRVRSDEVVSSAIRDAVEIVPAQARPVDFESCSRFRVNSRVLG